MENERSAFKTTNCSAYNKKNSILKMNPQLILKKPSEFTGLNRYSATQFILHGGREVQRALVWQSMNLWCLFCKI